MVGQYARFPSANSERNHACATIQNESGADKSQENSARPSGTNVQTITKNDPNIPKAVATKRRTDKTRDVHMTDATTPPPKTEKDHHYMYLAHHYS